MCVHFVGIEDCVLVQSGFEVLSNGFHFICLLYITGGTFLDHTWEDILVLKVFSVNNIIYVLFMTDREY